MPSNPANAPPKGASTILAKELGGDLPCARCKYNLRGLSIRAVCPECATPVGATLLAMVDPKAAELQRLHSPRLTAYGLIVWSVAALLGAVLVWGVRILGPLVSAAPRIAGELPPFSPGIAVVVLAAVSGLGALAFIYPHAMRSVSGAVLATLGVVTYLPLLWMLWLVHVEYDAAWSRPYGEGSLWRHRAAAVLGTHIAMIAITLCLRPHARLLWLRSLLMRTGRVDRQTLLAVAGALAVAILGDLLRIFSVYAGQGVGGLLDQIGQLLVLVGSLLLTLGLVGLVYDTVRLFPILVEPPISMQSLLQPDKPEARP